MLFDMSASSNSRKIMQLNPEYPKDVTMKSTDGTAVFKAEIAKHGRPDEYTYQWYVNGAAVAEANHKEYERNISGDKGQYTVWCEVTNKAGTDRTREAKLTVLRLPVLNSNYPANADVTISKDSIFSVSIVEHGYPANYTYQWYVNDSPVEGATAASYTRTAPAVGTETIYCVVTNDAGSVKSRTAEFAIAPEYIMKDGAGSWDSYKSFSPSWVRQENGFLYMHCDCSGYQGDVSYTRTWTKENYDFTGKNKLVFYCHKFASDAPKPGTFYFGACDSLNDDNFVAVSSVVAHNADGVYVTVDISQLSGVHHIKICCIKYDTHRDEVYVKDIYFE